MDSLEARVTFFGFEFLEKTLTVTPLNIAAFVYLAAVLVFFVGIARSGLKAQQSRASSLAQVLVVAGFVLHTVGLAGRWYVGGFDRPPWTNLYESLVAFAWMLAGFQIYSQRNWKIPLVGAFSTPLIFLLMGMSVMTPNKSLEPLIPALQSNWLKIHVVFGMISYAGFTMAACFGFLHLIRSRASLSFLGGGLCLMTVLNLGISGGREFLETGKFFMASTVEREVAPGQMTWVKDTYREYPDGPVITRMQEVPNAHPVFWAALLVFALAAILMFWNRVPHPGMKGYDISRRSLILFVSGLVLLLVFFGVVGYDMWQDPHLRMSSNPYLTMLLFMTLIICSMFVVISARYEKFLTSLPSADRLDELSYKNILFAFPFQALLLITGAVWAYSAWGRSWGWDPKETWALITWFAYLIYLHGKLLLRWKPQLLSVVSLIGFVIMVFAFLGVNLVLSGLHSYGAA